MAKRPARQAARRTKPSRQRTSARRSVKHPNKKAQPRRRSTALRATAGRKAGSASPARRKAAARKKSTSRSKPPSSALASSRNRKVPRLDRVRRTLEDTVPTPPSSLNMERRGSAARTGHAELAESLDDHAGMIDVAAGDVDVDIENAYFSGDEAPGGDNPTPDQDIVDDIGKGLGVQYADNEELKSADKIVERDKHRWEMDPASSEDYKDRR